MTRSDAFAAIADPTRRSILDSLREHESLTAGEIASRFPRVSGAAVSKHLGVLRRAHLVRAKHRGRENHYRLETDRLAELRRWLEYFAPVMEDSLQRLKERVEGSDTGG